jgi:curved DNA-binding protein CbpA
MTDRDAYQVLGLLPSAHDLVIQAAYRTLAALYHPDVGDVASTRRMAQLNDAYAKLRDPARRALYDAERRLRSAPAATVVTRAKREAAAPQRGNGSVLGFGRYQGWTIDRIAQQDADYLRWLGRHSSGIRYRAEIERALEGISSEPTMSERLRGR